MPELSSHPRLTIKIGPEPGRVFELKESDIILGRKPPASVALDHPLVSTKHARLTCEGGKWFLEDLGSRNGTFINKIRLRGRRELSDRDEISLGPILLLIFNVGQDSLQPAKESSAEPENSAPVESPGTILDMTAARINPRGDQPVIPPDLVVTVAGVETHTYPLVKDLLTIGRADDNDIIIPSMIVSRHHATLHLTRNGYEIEVIPGALNTLTCQGRPLLTRILLAHGDVLRIDSTIPGNMVSMTYLAPLLAAAKVPFSVQFGEKDRLTFGRDARNDVVLDMPNVSRFHAQVTRVGRRYYVTDLHSTNGTFVNDKAVAGDVWLEPQDTVRISQFRLVLGEDKFTRYDESTEGVNVEAQHLEKGVRQDLTLLQDISLSFQPREFVVIVGQSGGGKSTLLDAIAGYRPATLGKVHVNGIDIYSNFDAIRNEIGYVPQRDIIHMELTVYQALDFAAQLRMPRDTLPEERHKRIMEVLEDLDLTHRKDLQISGLSGGQQKRVSIGVELLTRPSLFYLDEPTSGLDPGTETIFMHLMRRLADQGRTIILVTHATKNVMLADKVVFLARGGYLAWYGPPDAALAYFDQYRSENDRRIREMEFDEIYSILDDPKKGKAFDWAERFKADPAYTRFISGPLHEDGKKPAAVPAAKGKKKGQGKGGRRSSLHQFMVLTRRNLTILGRDRSSMILMLAAPPAVGALDLLLAPAMGRAPFSFNNGDAHNGAITLFLLTLFALLVGGMSQMREFVKESHIYKRERLVNLQIFPYVSSKVGVALMLAFWHALAYTVIHYIAFRMPGNFIDFLSVYITMVFAVLTGMMLGLLASAVAPNSAAAPLTTILFVIPLIVLSGVLAPVPSAISQVASTRWAFQSMLGITGAGSDIAADVCWHLDEDLRDAMTLEDKVSQGCRCMGVQMFKEHTCGFPGVGKLFTPEIIQAEPTQPAPLADPPSEPTIPQSPTPPDDNYDQVKMAIYLNALVAYQDQVKTIQDNFRNEMDLYQVQAEVYTDKMTLYQEDLARYTIARVSAVKGAEGMISKVNEMFAWAWVDKSDPSIYIPWLLRSWLAQVEICLVYFLVILYMMKRKDIN
jgi:ABC-type multidrug transport system ATPase subunit